MQSFINVNWNCKIDCKYLLYGDKAYEKNRIKKQEKIEIIWKQNSKSNISNKENFYK